MNTPHTHPRATEILYAVNGTLTSGTIGENGSRFVFNTVHTGQATVFPVGSVHYQSNEGCEPMTFVCQYQLRFVRVWIVSYVFLQRRSATRTLVPCRLLSAVRTHLYGLLHNIV